MQGHSLSSDALRRFLAGTSGLDERREIARHLLQGCRVCCSFFRKFLAPFNRSVPTIGPSYDRAFEKAQSVITRDLDGLEETHRAFVELLSHPYPRQEMLIRHHRRYCNVAFCDLLIRESHEARFSDPGEMQRMARLAVLGAERLTTSLGNADQVADCRARAWMAFGNAMRVSGDLSTADRALARAQRHSELGEVSLVLKADLLSHISSLRLDQRRIDDALAISRRDIDIRRDLYSPREVAASLTKHAISLGEGGRPAEALAVLKEAERIAAKADSPQLIVIIRHNIIRFVMDDGNPELAHQLFLDAEPLYQEVKDPLIQTKATWLKGQILFSLGQARDALDLLASAQQHFLDQGNALEAAWVGLDRAVALSRMGRKQEVRRIAAASLHEFRAHRIQREYLAALILLRKAS